MKKRNYSKNADFYRVLGLNSANICVPKRDGGVIKRHLKGHSGLGVEVSKVLTVIFNETCQKDGYKQEG